VEEFLDGGPDGERVVVLLHDGVEEVGGDRRVEPVDDALVDHGPLRVGETRSGGGVDVVAEAELAEDRVEEAPPLGVGGVLQIENDGNMSSNVHRLDLGEGDSRVGWRGRRSHVGAAKEIADGIRGLRSGARGGADIHGSGRRREWVNKIVEFPV